MCGEGLESEFPPLKTLENRPTNLPAQATPLVGRERELADLERLLGRADVRLLTLTGPGGSGKTRLALQLAAESVEAFADGVWFVNLAALTDASQVLPTVAQTLAVQEEPGRPLADTLADELAGQRALVVLDNLEQVLEAAADLAPLLARAPDLKLVATSRIALRLSGEQEFPVPALADEEALALFVARAKAAKPSFSLNGNRPLVTEICRRLDRLPLAIELAAARVKLLPEKALLERLDDKLRLLTGGARDLPERQRTLRAAIEWSHGLLSADERTLFRRLAVFAGGRSLEAIEAVCNPDGVLDTIGLRGSLVDHSLLRQDETGDGEPRFVMLETIHDFAREQLATVGEIEDLAERHAEFVADAAESWADGLKTMDEDAYAFFDLEVGNLRGALAWAAEEDFLLFEIREGYVREGGGLQPAAAVAYGLGALSGRSRG